MRRSLRLVAVVLIAAPAVPAAPVGGSPPAPKGPTAEAVQQAIDDLASPRFAVRERASRILWEAGSAAEPALRAAAASRDEERANRARAILDKFDWGLYPDTPAEVVRLIEQFRGGDRGVRQEVTSELIRRQPIPVAILRKLLAQETDPESHQQIIRSMANQARDGVRRMIVAGRLDDADRLLELCLAPFMPATVADYAALQRFRGTVPQAVERMEAMRNSGNPLDAQRAGLALVHLHRVRQDWPAARKAAEALGTPAVIDDVAWESNDWKALAASTRPVTDEDDRGARAAYARLAGDRKRYDELMTELRQELGGVEGNDRDAYTLAEALLLNGQGAEAINILKDRPGYRPHFVFDLLCAQLRYREAFALADQAVKALSQQEGPAGEYQKDELNLYRARALAGLGDRDAAIQVFRGVLDRQLESGRTEPAVQTVKAMARAGLRDLTAECAARALVAVEKSGQTGVAVSLLDSVLPDHKKAALVWWEACRRDTPDAEPARVLERVMRFAAGKADRKQVDRLAGLIEGVRNLKKDPLQPDRNHLAIGAGVLIDFAIAEAYRLGNVPDRAEVYYKQAVGTKVSAEASPVPLLEFDLDEDLPHVGITHCQLAYADLLMSRNRPREAAAVYRQAWELNPVDPLPLFLQGHALTQAGDDKEGTRLRDLAHRLPLAEEPTRAAFSDELNRRGFEADSRKEMDLVLATGWFRSYQVGNLYLRAARIQARKNEYATAALYYDKDLISLLRGSAQFIDPRAYLTVPEAVRSYRARALLAAGKTDEALAEARAGLAAVPGNVELAIGLVPDLDRAGKTREADEVYASVKAAFQAALKEFPASPDLRNGLAWTMVNCNRDLEEARTHSEKAVSLSPDSAGYIDTLAEINFRLKNRAKAMELIRKSLELEPTNPYFRKQLVRFEKRPFDSPLPDEETGDD